METNCIDCIHCKISKVPMDDNNLGKLEETHRCEKEYINADGIAPVPCSGFEPKE